MMKYKQYINSCAILLIFIITACSTESNISGDLVNKSLEVNGVNVSVVGVQLRNSVQTHYLMDYPESHHTFLEVILTIEGLDASPEEILDWGIENLGLNCDGTASELAFPRRVIADDEVEYKVGEYIQFDYVYIFSVLRDTDFETCQLIFSDGQDLSLSPFIKISDSPDSTTQPEEQGVVLSGEDNLAFGENAVVAGGTQNSANAVHTTVTGGNMNAATTSHATVAGGRENSAVDFYATVGGGYGNIASARDTFVGGGSRNTASGPRATIGGGIQNRATAPDTIIAGGAYNQAEDDYAFVGGGTRNFATGYASVICGGAGNVAGNDQATVGGGLGNQVDGKYGTVGGGYGNQVSGNYSSIPGGFENNVSGDFSFAAGQQAVISANHPGVFVFSDATDAVFSSVAANEFAVRATGGVRFVSALDSNGEILSGIHLAPGSGSWATLSDQSAKTDYTSINQQEVLASLVDLPISEWSYRGQDVSVRHIGPVSQDFYAAFGLGEDEHYINTVDADGIAFAAIQGMYEIIQQQEMLIREQVNQIAELETRLEVVELRRSSLQKSQPEITHWLGWALLIGFVVGNIWAKWKPYNSGLSNRKP